MKKVRLASIVFAAGLLGVLFIVTTHRDHRERTAINGNEDLILGADEIVALEGEARAGSTEAAIRLARYFDMIALDKAAARKWWLHAATHGNARAQYAVGLAMMNSDVPDEVLKGRQWMERAALAGDRAAELLLEQRPAAPASEAKSPL
ncbi:hypothetical protein ACFJGW_10890 [Burkholderiaceae bacterium UC74_6]